jgi:NADPH:quinone reductase-like Zn-dependent oxidoreductase
VRAIAVRTFRTEPKPMDLPEPVPKDGEVRVRVGAAGVNPLDWKVIDGIYEGRRPHIFPLVIGVDAAGTVVEVGRGVRRFTVGDRICGQFLHDPVGTGTYAEQTVVPESIGVAAVPSGIPSNVAASLPTAGMTALGAVEQVGVPTGGTVLIVGASGGVGTFATALAAARQLHVLATARPSSEAMVRGLGAEATIDPSAVDLVAEVRQRHPNGVDALLDFGSDKPTFARLAGLVRRGGTALTITFVADTSAGQADGIRRVNFGLEPKPAVMERLLGEVAAGRISAPEPRVLGLDDGPRALAESRSRTSVGKTVLAIA